MHLRSLSSSPARLSVLLASRAPTGVILRRGPSDWVQLIRWNTDSDTFTPGQWFHGRVYEWKCDLSPDGQLLVYFAYKPVNPAYRPDYGDQWTAVSRPPYFTALALWPRSVLFGGGGYFVGNRSLLLNHLYEDHAPHPAHQPPADFEVMGADEQSYMHGRVFEWRMARDGWQLGAGNRTKVTGDLKITCRIVANYRELMETGLYRHTFYDIPPALRYHVTEPNGTKHYRVPGITWADFDQRNRLVLARQGRLFTGMVQAGELVVTELADFNANRPEPVEAPEWAKRW